MSEEKKPSRGRIALVNIPCKLEKKRALQAKGLKVGDIKLKEAYVALNYEIVEGDSEKPKKAEAKK